MLPNAKTICYYYLGQYFDVNSGPNYCTLWKRSHKVKNPQKIITQLIFLDDFHWFCATLDRELFLSHKL